LALAQYIAYLGPPPPEMIKQSPLSSTYFDEEGKFQHLIHEDSFLHFAPNFLSSITDLKIEQDVPDTL
jgi:hypothetical protein